MGQESGKFLKSHDFPIFSFVKGLTNQLQIMPKYFVPKFNRNQ